MNKPQYLAELNQLLIFMTKADREDTLARYGALFDKAGPDGQEALLSRVGSPTHLAIRLSRIYDAGGYTDELLESLEAMTDLSPELMPDEEDEPEDDGPSGPDSVLPVEDDLPAYDLPDLPDLPEAPAPAQTAPPQPSGPARFVPLSVDGEDGHPAEASAAPVSPTPEKQPAPPAEADAPDGDIYADEDAGGDGEPSYTVVRVMPLWVGVPLFILSLLVLILPLALVGILLIPVLALPGLAVLLAAFLAFVGALWCLSIIADAAMLLGLAFLLLALGLVVLWCGLWLDVALVNGFSSLAGGLAHLTLGRKVTAYA